MVQQANALAGRAPAIVALQEVTRQTLPLWERAFALMGLPHVRSSLARGYRVVEAPRSTGVLIAARTPLVDVEHPLSVPWPEKALCAVAQTSPRPVEVFCVHVPNAANGTVKPETLRAVRQGVEAATAAARIVCGDLNTPRRELPTGEVVSFARDRDGRLRSDRGPAWDAAELGVVPGLRDLGYRDVYREQHGYGRADPSWTWKRIAGHQGGWRLDHIFASTQLRTISCFYHHAWRDLGLSDHSAMEAEFTA
jgi:endonuclease/exonuclease/phosphatase family metal-dependent hydrolase